MSNVTSQVTAISTAIIMVTLVVLVIMVAFGAWRLHVMMQRAAQAMTRVYADLAPLIKSATSVSNNVDRLVDAVRGEVDKVTDTVSDANDRVRQAVSITEDRLNEFNALLRVVQDEAEQVFLSTASTVRGVRSGAELFGRRRGMDLASDELETAHEAEDIQLEEEEDGDDGSSEPAAPALPAAPRVRPRVRGGGGRRA